MILLYRDCLLEVGSQGSVEYTVWTCIFQITLELRPPRSTSLASKENIQRCEAQGNRNVKKMVAV